MDSSREQAHSAPHIPLSSVVLNTGATPSPSETLRGVDKETVNTLLMSPDAETRKLCALAIKEKGISCSVGTELSIPLDALVRDADETVRASIAQALPKFMQKDLAIPVLLYTLRDSSEFVQVAALETLMQLSPNPELVLPALFELYESTVISHEFRVQLLSCFQSLDQNWKESRILRKWNQFREDSDEAKTALSALAEQRRGLSYQVSNNDFETAVLGAYYMPRNMPDTEKLTVQTWHMRRLSELANTTERKHLALTTLLYKCGDANKEMATHALQMVRHFEYGPEMAMPIALSVTLGNFKEVAPRLRALELILSLCLERPNSDLSNLALQSLHDWLSPDLREKRETLVPESGATNEETLPLFEADEDYNFLSEQNSDERDTEVLHQKFRIPVASALGELASRKTQFPEGLEATFFDLAKDADPAVRSTAFIALGRCAHLCTARSQEIAALVGREQDFEAKGAGLWCLQRLAEGYGDHDSGRPVRAAVFKAAHHIRNLLQEKSLEQQDFSQMPILIHALAHQQQLGLIARDCRLAYQVAKEALAQTFLNEARIPVALAAIKLMPYLPSKSEQKYPGAAAVRLLTKVALETNINHFAPADRALNQPLTWRFPEAEQAICALLDVSDSVSTLKSGFHALQSEDNRLIVTLRAQLRPEPEQRQVLKVYAHAASLDAPQKLLRLLESGIKYFEHRGDGFSHTWKISFLEAIDTNLSTVESRMSGEQRGQMKKILAELGRDSHPQVRAISRQLLTDLQSPWQRLGTKLVGGLNKSTNTLSQSVSASDRKPPDAKPWMENQSLSASEQKYLEQLEDTTDEFKEVRLEATRVLLYELRDSEIKQRSLNELLTDSQSIAVRATIAEFRRTELRLPGQFVQSKHP